VFISVVYFQDLTVQQKTPIRVLHRSGYMAFFSQDFFKTKGKKGMNMAIFGSCKDIICFFINSSGQC
jgi:hypothetical protein